MPVRTQNMPIFRSLAPVWCTASRIVLLVPLLLFCIGYGGAAIDMKDCPVIYNISCKAGNVSLNVTTEPCGNDCEIRLMDVQKTVHGRVSPGQTVTISCSSPVYYLSADNEPKKKLACYILTNETTSTPGRRDGDFHKPTEDPRPPNQSFHLLWLLLIVLLSIPVLIGGAVYLWKRWNRRPPGTSYEVVCMNGPAPPAAQL